LKNLKTLLTQYKEQILYLLFGGVTSVIGVGVYELFYRLGFASWFANTVSTVLAVTVAYVTNKLFVFESKGLSRRELWREIVTFYGGRLFTYLLETGLLMYFVDYKKFSSIICKVCTTVLVIILNYVISKLFVFKKKQP